MSRRGLAGRCGSPENTKPTQSHINFLTVIFLIWHITPMSPFEAIAEPNRRAILDLLRGGELPAGDLVEATGLSQPGVSKHLKLLPESGRGPRPPPTRGVQASETVWPGWAWSPPAPWPGPAPPGSGGPEPRPSTP